MLGQTFYHQTIRKYVVLFGTLFNDLNIEKKNSSGNVVSRQKVPIAYGPKQKFLTRIRQDPNIKTSAITDDDGYLIVEAEKVDEG